MISNVSTLVPNQLSYHSHSRLLRSEWEVGANGDSKGERMREKIHWTSQVIIPTQGDIKLYIEMKMGQDSALNIANTIYDNG